MSDPNLPSPNDPSKLAQTRLAEACQTKDTSVRLAWAITICEAILLGVFAIALADYWLMLPVWIRSSGGLIVASLAGIGIFRLVRFYRRPTRLKEAALDVEAQRPALGCEISTAAEYLSGERKIQHEYEPELVAALQAEAAKKLKESQVRYERKVVRPAVILAITLFALLTFVLAAPVALTALQRTALPFSKARYTNVEVKPGNIEVPVGRDVEITNLFTGRIPKDPRLHLQKEGVPEWQSVALTRSNDGAYIHALKNLRSDVTYRVTGNDAESDNYRITTYVPPEVKDLNIQLKYPDYTKLRPATQKSPDITAVRASMAQVRIQPSVELGKAKLRFSAMPDVPLQPAEDGSWIASVTVTKDTEYWIELADKKSHLGVNEKPYHIKALPDKPPKVEITEPGKDTRSTATNKIPLKISVADDFGVSEIKVIFHKLGSSEQVINAKRETEQNGEVMASADLELSQLGLHEYELVAYHVEASDNNTLDGPGIGKSPTYFVEITNEEAGECKSQTQGQKVNLLVIQKQVIADTTALAANAASEKFDELAARQRDATEFGRMYLTSISAGGAATEAATAEMGAAIKDMETAVGYLGKQKRADSIPPEENALAHLYQVIKLLPELENLPTTPQLAKEKPPQSPKVKVVLEAIKQKKKEQPDNQELEEALQEAKNLARAQSGLNAALRNQGDASGRGQGDQPGEGQSKNSSKNPNPGQGKSQGTGKGKGQGKGQGQGQGTAGENPKESSEEKAESLEPQKPAQLAEKENELSKEAAALAEKLKRLAGKDTRVGHNAGGNAGRASSKMAEAAKAVKQGGFGAAGENGFQGELAMRRVIDQLERILKNQPEPTDVANEDFPKEFEGLISEYLKKLSHVE